MDEEILDVIRDVVAFMAARYRDDEAGGYAILMNTDPVQFMIAQADYSIALVRTICQITGMPEDRLVEKLTQNAGLMFGGLSGK